MLNFDYLVLCTCLCLFSPARAAKKYTDWLGNLQDFGMTFDDVWGRLGVDGQGEDVHTLREIKLAQNDTCFTSSLLLRLPGPKWTMS